MVQTFLCPTKCPINFSLSTDVRKESSTEANDKLKFIGHRLAFNDWIFNAWGNKYEELKQDDAIPNVWKVC